ncbi:MAG TPA: phosphotransferase [Roseiflexaceae bacterium]|nr:phosphotransferase [Roseiflexaceae bacterium]
MMTIFPPDRLYRLPRPDRLYQRLSGRQLAVEEGARLQAVLAHYGLRAEGEARAPGGEGRSRSLIVATAAGTKIVKRYKASVEQEAIAHEHSILLRLAALGFPAPRLCATTDGATLVWHEDGAYAVFDYIAGYFQYHNYLFPPGQVRRFIAAAGEALAALHAALRDFTPAGRNVNGFVARDGGRWRDRGWFEEQLEQCRQELLARPAHELSGLRRAVTAHAGWVAARLAALEEQLGQAGLPRLIIHGDYGPYNLLFRPGAPVVILDFELARLDWRLTDLAAALRYFASGRLGFSAGRARCFLAAYASRCPLERAELRLLAPVWQYLTLRRLIVCWRRAASTGARHWADESRTRLELARWLEEQQGTLPDIMGM